MDLFGFVIGYLYGRQIILGIILILFVCGLIARLESIVLSAVEIILTINILSCIVVALKSLFKEHGVFSKLIPIPVIVTQTFFLVSLIIITSSIRVNEVIAYLIFLGFAIGESVILGIASRVETTKKRVMAILLVAAAFALGRFSYLWSIGCGYENLEDKDAAIPRLTTYSVNYDFDLYKKASKDDDNTLIGSYPAGTAVKTYRKLLYSIEYKPINTYSESHDNLCGFLGPVSVEDGQNGYIAVYGNSDYYDKYVELYKEDKDYVRLYSRTSKIMTREEFVSYEYLNTVLGSSVKASFLSEKDTISQGDLYLKIFGSDIDKAETLYEKYDFLGFKTYKERNGEE